MIGTSANLTLTRQKLYYVELNLANDSDGYCLRHQRVVYDRPRFSTVLHLNNNNNMICLKK